MRRDAGKDGTIGARAGILAEEIEKEEDEARLGGIRVGSAGTHDHIVGLVSFIFVRKQGEAERSGAERRVC